MLIIISCSLDGLIKMWNNQSFKCMRTIEKDKKQIKTLIVNKQTSCSNIFGGGERTLTETKSMRKVVIPKSEISSYLKQSGPSGGDSVSTKPNQKLF